MVFTPYFGADCLLSSLPQALILCPHEGSELTVAKGRSCLRCSGATSFSLIFEPLKLVII